MVVADYDISRAEAAVAALKERGDRFSAQHLDASDVDAVRRVLAEHECEVLLNATDPRFVMPLFNAALSAGTHYLDMAMSLSAPHASRPYEECGVKLGDQQFGLAHSWEKSGCLALVGMGVEPGLSDVFARYAAEELFDQIEEIGIRDGASLTVEGYDFAPTWVKGTKDGQPRQVYLYHVVDNQWSMHEYGSQAVVWQTAINPVVALELLATGAWSGKGVLGPEALPPRPFLDLLTEYGSPWGQREQG